SEANRRKGTRPPFVGQSWTAEEEAFLGKLPDAEVVKRTKRTLMAVRCRRQQLRIPALRADAWSPDEEALIRTLPSDEEIAERTGRTVRSVLKHRLLLRI